ncbi:class I glutamine amidotransferase-like protein [Sistotremastrum suecicum HHB10207 ss-3]|uniref:Class I glutamine amidotransferase-like protein n=1 Tax=Sistotremastrum suecicum HHB10207 ss-3 TaxID=1314776 RepID=A0A166GYK1_9AGAM|nr:class I glutamine amidotransferase-like protein [Sistotremastrum suecicum HHB10207 ss-3]
MSFEQDFRHDSIPTAINALKQKGPSNSPPIIFDNTEDQNFFTTANLSQYDAILFLSTTGEVLDASGKAAFQTYLNQGGNFVGIHSASDTLRNTTFYMEELVVLDNTHPSTSMLPTRWPVQDEFYNFKSDPRSVGAVVVLTVDESTYTDDGVRKFDQGTPHPIAWYQERGAGSQETETAGRSWYTSLGHLNQTWEDDLYLQHVMGGISWTLAGNTTKAFSSNATVGNANSLDGNNPSSTITSTSTSVESTVLPSSSSGSTSAAPAPSSDTARHQTASGTLLLSLCVALLALMYL